jgi:hypothetical protein
MRLYERKSAVTGPLADQQGLADILAPVGCDNEAHHRHAFAKNSDQVSNAKVVISVRDYTV